MKYYYYIFILYLLISPSFQQLQWGEERQFVSVPLQPNGNVVLPGIPPAVGAYNWPYAATWDCLYTTVGGPAINYPTIPRQPGIYFYYGTYTPGDRVIHNYLPAGPHVLYMGMSTTDIRARVRDHYTTDFCMPGPALGAGATRQDLYVRARRRACNVCWLPFHPNPNMGTKGYTPDLYEGLLFSFIASAGNHVKTGGCGPGEHVPINNGNVPTVLAVNNFFQKANSIIMNYHQFQALVP